MRPAGIELILRGGLLFLLALPLVAVPFGRQDDIHIKSFKGDYQKTNSQGGFIIDQVFGNCYVDSLGGPLKFGRVQGDLTGTTRGGDVRVEEVSGNVRLFTQSGNILVRQAGGQVVAETNLGEIVIEKAASVEAKTLGGGDIKIQGASGFVSAQARGNVTFVSDGSYAGDILCNLSAVDGDITIYIPEDLSVSLLIRTPVTMDVWRETRIESDFSFSDFKQNYEKEQTLILSFNINKGGRKILLAIEKGNVSILKLKTKKAGR